MIKLPPPLTFFLIAVVSVVIWWRALLSTFSLAWGNEAYTHILLILPVAVGMIYVDRSALQSRAASNWHAGAILLLAALTATGFARWRSTSLASDIQLSIYMLALVLWWIGAFVGCFGTRVSRLLLFPLCFLFWLVPFPTFLLNTIVSHLQQESASAARILFEGADVPVAQSGVMLSIPGLTVEVAKECSSIRSSLMLLVITMVLAHLSLRSPWRKSLVLAVAVPLCVAKNGLRIFTIAMLATHVDPSFLTGRLHHNGGIVFLLIALAMIFILLWVLRRTENRVPTAPRFTAAGV